jgi:hypothetical protein
MKQLYRILWLLPLIGCGSWAGNGDKDKDKDAEERTLLAGDVIYHKLTLPAGGSLFASYSPVSTSLRLTADPQNFEISVISPDGKELAYDRQGGDTLAVNASVAAAGDYVIAIKNNADTSVELKNEELNGVDADNGLIKALDAGSRNTISLKAVVALARQCKQYADGGNSTTTRTAPEGEFFVQPFVFMGTVDLETRKVSPITDASITISGGGRSMTLSKLDDFDLSVFRETGSLTKAEHVAYTRNFYQGYFGAAGEFYTVDTFRFGGDCSKMPSFKLAENPGETEMSLSVASSAAGVSESFALRPTVSTAFTLYTGAGQKLDNWDPCSYDAFTAEPKNYNKPTEPCRELNPQDPPYVTLDYLLPSAQYPDQYTAASDPTRIMYYGHSLARAFKKAILENEVTLRDGSLDTISLDSCMNNGGIHSVAISKDPSYLPLNEFNMVAGDLIQLNRKTGSYTALTEYFQGNADISGTLQYPACIPDSGTQESCKVYKVLTVNSSACRIKADSGVFVTSLHDSFIYPEYFELSGSLKK